MKLRHIYWTKTLTSDTRMFVGNLRLKSDTSKKIFFHVLNSKSTKVSSVLPMVFVFLKLVMYSYARKIIQKTAFQLYIYIWFIDKLSIYFIPDCILNTIFKIIVFHGIHGSRSCKLNINKECYITILQLYHFDETDYNW